MIGGNFSINSCFLYQQDCDSNNGDVSCGYGFINSHTISQFDDPITVKGIDGGLEKGDVIILYGSTNSHTVYQPNGSKIKGRDDMDMNANLHNGNLSSGIGLLKTTLSTNLTYQVT